jgi:SAM-dependent methyltransferase
MYSKRCLAVSESFLRDFHARSPGSTERAVAGGVLSGGRTSYQWIADHAPLAKYGPVLDLGSGSGQSSQALLASGSHPIAVDISKQELAYPNPTSTTWHRVVASATALPFADHAFAHAVCHMAFMLMRPLDIVVSEIARVLRPHAQFVAIVGGGPPATGAEAWDAYASALADVMGNVRRVQLADKRGNSEAGWASLFCSDRRFVSVNFVRDVLILDGNLEQVWARCCESYDDAALDSDGRLAVQQRFCQRVKPMLDGSGKLPMRWVVWRAVAQRA